MSERRGPRLEPRASTLDLHACARRAVVQGRIDQTRLVRRGAVCSRTCLTRVDAVAVRSSSRWAPSGAQPASVRNARSVVVVGDQPDHGAGEPVGDASCRRAACSSREPWPVPRSSGSTVSSQQLAVGDRVAVGVGGRAGDREADDPVALQGDQHPVAGVRRAGQRVAPRLRRTASASSGSAPRPAPAPAYVVAPGADLDRGDRRRRRRPRRPGPRRRRWGCSWRPSCSPCGQCRCYDATVGSRLRTECHIAGSGGGVYGNDFGPATEAAAPARLRPPSSPGWRPSARCSPARAGSSRATGCPRPTARR